MPFVPTIDGDELEYQPMDGADLRNIRRALGLKKCDFGKLCGMTGEDSNITMTIERYERGRRSISPMLERLAWLLLWFYEDHGRLPDLDNSRRGDV